MKKSGADRSDSSLDEVSESDSSKSSESSTSRKLVEEQKKCEEAEHPGSEGVWTTIQVLGSNPNYPGQKDNEIHTTRYRWWSFLPLMLYEQYRVLTNVYFLIVLVVTFLPWSPVNYIFQLMPVLFVLIVSMVKSGVEDLIKRREDRKRNNAPVLIYRDGEFRQMHARDIRVGDVVKMSEDALVPSDILFIGSDQDAGLAYYSEANLNGETAVKTMQCHPAFDHHHAIEQLESGSWSIDVGKPDRDLTRFDARLKKGNEFWPITIHHMLLRGVSTHYTENIIGIVIRTGHDTKVMQNMKRPPAKMTQFDRNLNKILIIVFCFKLLLCLGCTFAGVAFDNGSTFKVIEDLYPGYGQSWGEYFVQYFILYSYLFPPSMQVTIEIIRLFHSIVIYHDPDLIDEEFGNAASRNSNVICQLGSVTHLLSDKTGTLTENIMELLKFATNSGKFVASDFVKTMEIDPALETTVLPLLLGMAICNNVIVHEKSDGTLEYNADSPDEAAFVSFAEKCGVKLVARGLTSISVNVKGELRRFDILAHLPFNSDRKRQSLLVKQGDEPAIRYCKGADNVIAERSIDFAQETTINEFAAEGLRTLVFTMREIKDEELEPWLEKFRRAEASLSERDELVFECAEEIETSLSTIGITGVEDRLQKEVPETIAWLKRAGIKVWVLTGDKLETAIAIGKTSGIIQKNSDMIIIGNIDSDTIERRLDAAKNNLETFQSLVLICTADTLEIAMERHRKKFLAVADAAEAVVLARVSPFMKAQVTEMVRNEGHMVMAIGDGANDVGMLQVAHVGVGVYGREGSQAALSADFALPRFRFLKRLLMVHGHWTYRRFSVVAVMMLWKNFVFIIAQLWFAIDTLWSPTSLYSDFLMSCFNLVFTVLPPFIFGFWEQDLPQDVLMANPELYRTEDDPLSVPFLIYYLLLGVWQSACAFFAFRIATPRASLAENGTMTYLAVVYIVVIQVIIWGNYHNMWSLIFYLVNIVLTPIIVVVYIILINWELISALKGAMASPTFWLAWILAVLAALLPGFLIDFMRKRFRPTKVRRFVEAEYMAQHKPRIPGKWADDNMELQRIEQYKDDEKEEELSSSSQK